MSATDLVAHIEALHRPVDIEPSSTICGECSFRLPNGRYFGKVVEYPCSTLEVLAGVLPLPESLDPTEEEVEVAARALREQAPGSTAGWEQWVWTRFARAALLAAREVRRG